MTGLRERIEAERAALLDERAIAEAATPGPWQASDFGHPGDQEPTSSVIHRPPFVWRDLRDGEGAVAWCHGDNDQADAAHIARQDPTTTIARIDRELARIDADLALLDAWEDNPGDDGAVAGWRNLNVRYPETEDDA